MIEGIEPTGALTAEKTLQKIQKQEVLEDLKEIGLIDENVTLQEFNVSLDAIKDAIEKSIEKTRAKERLVRAGIVDESGRLTKYYQDEPAADGVQMEDKEMTEPVEEESAVDALDKYAMESMKSTMTAKEKITLVVNAVRKIAIVYGTIRSIDDESKRSKILLEDSGNRLLSLMDTLLKELEDGKDKQD
jgi:hypothetical protein